MAISDMLSSLNADFSQVTDLIPNKLNLTDDPAIDYWTLRITGNFVKELSDGKIIWAGKSDVRVYNSDLDDDEYKYNLVKFNTDGTIDETFTTPNFGGGNNGYVRSVAEQSDGKLIVVGHFETVNGQTVNRICRLNANGTLDETFNSGTGFNNTVLSVAVLSDDSIIAGGTFSQFDGETASRLVKLNSDGSYHLDSANIEAIPLNDHVHVVFITPADKILVGGQFTGKIKCYNDDGTEEAGFVVGSGFQDPISGPNQRVSDFALQDDGKILVAHWFRSYDGTPVSAGIVRLNSNGTFDNTFNFFHGDSKTITDIAVSAGGTTQITCTAHALSSGDIISISASDSVSDIDGVWRISTLSDDAFEITYSDVTTAGTTGTFVKSGGFGNSDSSDWRNQAVQAVAVQDDGKIVLGGWFTKFAGESQNYLVRVNDEGVYDPTFDVSDKFLRVGDEERIQDIYIDESNNIFLAHDLRIYDGNFSDGLTKIDSSGDFQEIDLITPIDRNGLSWDFPWLHKILQQDDGKIIVCGIEGRQDGFKGIRRLNLDGSEDTTFGPVHVNSTIRKADFQNEKIIIAGDFNEVHSRSCKYIARLNSDGSLDETFNITTGVDGTIYALKVLSDDKIWIGGGFGQFGDTPIDSACRLTANGELDFSPDFIYINETVHVIEEDTDGKVLIGGQFNASPINISNVATSDGATTEITLASNHNLDSGAYVYIEDSASEPSVDGIWEISNASGNSFTIDLDTVTVSNSGGSFYSYPHNYLFRLNTDDTVDTDFLLNTFNNSIGSNPRVSSLAIQNDEKIVIGHWFEGYGVNQSKYVTRVNADGSYDSSFEQEGTGLSASTGGTMVVKLDQNGSVYAGGFYESYDGNPQSLLIKLNSDGTKDDSFDVGIGFDEQINGNPRIMDVIADDENVYVAGNFSIYKQDIRWNLIKLDSSGDLISSYKMPLPYKTYGISNSNNDMFDGGHYINTNLTQSFDEGQKDRANPYLSIANTHTPIGDDSSRSTSTFLPENQDGTIEDGSTYFGTGSSYFTNIYPGLRVLVATGVTNDVTEVSILGESADNPTILTATVELDGGFTGFIRKELNGEPTSLHQMIIVNGDTSSAQIFYTPTGGRNDFAVKNISTDSIFILTMATDANDAEITDQEMTAIGNKFLSVMNMGYKTVDIDLSPTPGFIPAYGRGEGSLDTAILNGNSLQRTGYIETVNSQGGRKVVAFADGEVVTDQIQALEDYLSVKKS
jgi:uncharacterized delta-60 repeat protein